MATFALEIDMPVGAVYDTAKLKMMVTNYIYKLVAIENNDAKKSSVSNFRKLRGAIKSDIPFEDMRREAIKDKLICILAMPF